jgi:hypothetical protein
LEAKEYQGTAAGWKDQHVEQPNFLYFSLASELYEESLKNV